MRNKTGPNSLFIHGLIFTCLLLVWIWCGIGLYLALPVTGWLRAVLAVGFELLLPVLFWKTRTFYRGLAASLVCLVVFFLWWQTLQPTNDKEWAPDVARIAHGEIQGDILHLENIRNFNYYKENTSINDWQKEELWEVKDYNLDAIQGLDLFLSYWASEHIAHVIVSWDFGYGKHLAISIETRKDIHQEYSTVKGFFKQFELAYVAAEEKDLIRLRTNFRKERVYLYRLFVGKEKARALLEAYVQEMNKLLTTPKFYGALTRNCTTAIFLHTKAINPDDPPPLDWRIVVSGHLDELLYEKGLLNRKIPFTELRKQSRVDLRTQGSDQQDFSRLLRTSQAENQ